MRHRPFSREPEPGFYYGGLPRPQFARGSNPWDRHNLEDWKPGDAQEEITGTVPICKLHGSLNWELAGDQVTIWRDNRLPYRRGSEAAIVAPVPEKQAPDWLRPVWDDAACVLAQAEIWIVVGYSLPPYDHAVRELLSSAIKIGGGRRIFLHDPEASALVPRWSEALGVRPVAARELGPTRWAVERPAWYGRDQVAWAARLAEQRSEAHEAAITPETWS